MLIESWGIDFKSYKGHQSIYFGNSYFTSIIGPNGSGKSNWLLFPIPDPDPPPPLLGY